MRSIHKHFEKMDQRGVMACNPLAIVASIAGTLTLNLVSALGIRGSSTGLVSACASSGHALGMALGRNPARKTKTNARSRSRGL